MPRTEKPPGVADALTLWTPTCGAENTVSVAKPPNGTSGTTTSLPFSALTVASALHLTGAGQLVTQVLGGDPGQHQLGHHQHRQHQRAEADRG